MEASLTCAVCLSLFEEPVTLPVCSHNFCRPCVLECLGLAQGAAVEPPPAGASGSPGRAHGQDTGDAVSVMCPLCRKLSPLPSGGGGGGAPPLPVNTTLAEVVKLFKGSLPAGMPRQDAAAALPEAASAALAPQLAALGVSCAKHPGLPLQLYCRRCLRGACGQCVSEEHHGVFHSVNLIDTVYQEEKLAFFSNLKKIRDLHENLIKEVSPNDAGVITLNEEIIKAEFEKVYNALEVRKKQLLEDVEVQKKRKLKESLIWKRMKEVHKKTIENVLNDCEKLLHEYDPQRFLEVACNLNQRMKTQLDLMQIACSHENQSECKQVQLDTTDIVNDILALSLTADIPSRDVEHSTSASPENKLQVKENVQNTFYPVPGENIVSLSAATEFGRISHEEMRYNYYMKNQVCLDERETQTSPQNENHLLLKSLPSKSTIPGHVSPWFHAEAKNEKFKVATLQRPCFSKAGLSNSFGFTFNVQAMNLNFCSSKNNLNLHSVNHSQNDAKEASLSALRNSCQNSTKPLQLNAVTLPSEGLFSFSVFPKLSGATAVATANPHVLGAAAGHSASPLIFGPSKESAQIFEKEKPRSVSLAKFERLHGNIKKSGTTISGNPFLTTFPNNSDSDPCQTATVNSSQEKSFSYLIADQKIFQENKAICFRKLSNKDNSWLTSSATDSNNHLFRNSNDAFPITGTISTSTASYMIVAPEKQPVADSGSSKSECCTNNTPFLFSFNGTTQNYGGSLTSIEPFKNTECTTEKSKMNYKDKKLTVQKPVPFVAACKEWEDTRSSFASINKGPIAETCSPFVPQHAIAHDFTANSALVSVEPPKSENPLEIPPPTIDHRAVNSDSDVEDLSQASIVSDSSSTSEYFSVSEDKISS